MCCFSLGDADVITSVQACMYGTSHKSNVTCVMYEVVKATGSDALLIPSILDMIVINLTSHNKLKASSN